MCTDIRNGILRLSEDLIMSPGYTFEDFKKTSYYKGQDGIRVITLDDRYNIEGNTFLVSLVFVDGRLDNVSLFCTDEEFSWETEPERKKLHDRILNDWGLSGENLFEWGNISSVFDAKSCVSSVVIRYR
ncbi:MAG: hypothetical protein K6F49_10495 [Saccharofermentans sp.]|nr:hypothetical protein [Saccharofermentans sp.]